MSTIFKVPMILINNMKSSSFDMRAEVVTPAPNRWTGDLRPNVYYFIS